MQFAVQQLGTDLSEGQVLVVVEIDGKANLFDGEAHVQGIQSHWQRLRRQPVTAAMSGGQLSAGTHREYVTVGGGDLVKGCPHLVAIHLGPGNLAARSQGSGDDVDG